jgi:hypothetical protein
MNLSTSAGKSRSLADTWATLAESLRAMNPWRLSLALGLLTAVLSLLQDRPQAFQLSDLLFVDGDDVLRLQQVRGLLNGEGWFTPMIRNIGDGAGLQSHWSRLVDAPIALLMLLGGLFLPQAAAEHLAMLLWPKLLLAAFLCVLFRELIREGGLQAAGAFLLIIALSTTGFMQFQLLRIDHHNVQIACAILSLVLATSRFATPSRMLAAGATGGFGLAVGYEALPIIGITAGLLALAALWDRSRHVLALSYAGGLALMLAATFAATMPPGHWLPIPCDALGLNVVLAAAAGALGLLAAGRLRSGRTGYALALAATAVIAAAALLRLEPACAGGPFARFDPAMDELWLRHVREARTLLDIGRDLPELCLAIAITIVLGCGLQAWAVKSQISAETIMRLVIVIILAALGFRYLKMLSYAQFFACVCASLAITTLPRLSPSVSPGITKALAVLAMCTAFQINLASALVTPPAEREGTGQNFCQLDRHFAALKALPSSRILPQQDIGGFLVQLPQHHIMTGNYHRLDKEIMRGAAIFRASPADALKMLNDWNIDLVVHCLDKTFYKGAIPSGSLADLLHRETPPGYLTALPTDEGSRVRAFRVVRNEGILR